MNGSSGQSGPVREHEPTTPPDGSQTPVAHVCVAHVTRDVFEWIDVVIAVHCQLPNRREETCALRW